MLLLERLLRNWDTLVVLELIPCIRDTQDLQPLPHKFLLVRDTDETEKLLIGFYVQWTINTCKMPCSIVLIKTEMIA